MILSEKAAAFRKHLQTIAWTGLLLEPVVRSLTLRSAPLGVRLEGRGIEIPLFYSKPSSFETLAAQAPQDEGLELDLV